MSFKLMVVAHFCDDFGVDGNNRFNYLAKLLSTQGARVELVTSSFSHTTKQPKQYVSAAVENVRVTYIHEPNYNKNVSFRRMWAHRTMAKNLRAHLKQCEVPDMVVCALPSLSVADEVRSFCQQHNVPFVIDVQDLWPEAFYMISPVGKLNKRLFLPLSRQADRIYRAANAVIAVSDRYRARAMSVHKGRSEPLSKTLYLGTELKTFDELAAKVPAPVRSTFDQRPVTFVYLGTLGHSYDLKTAIRAFQQASSRSTQPLKLTIIGDGPKYAEFKRYAAELGVAAEFTGRLDYPRVVARLMHCDVALNTISKGAAQSIINKHGDYAAAGLPVISTQQCTEYGGLLRRFNAGVSCPVQDSHAVAGAMLTLARDPVYRAELAKGSRAMAETLFDRAATYPSVLGFLTEVRRAYQPALKEHAMQRSSQ